MFARKTMFSVCILSVALISICSAQVAKSQATSSPTTDKQSSSRSYIGGGTGGAVDPNSYMNQVFQHKQPIDLMHILPIVLIAAIIPLVLPLIIQLFAGLFSPQFGNFGHFGGQGRRKRDADFHTNQQLNQLLLSLISNVGDSLTKYQ